MNSDGILILGAGPAGLACAMELVRAEKKFYIVEKDKQVGGLAKTYQFGNFRTDNGPHRFFSQNRYLYEFIEDLIGERWIKVDRSTKFYINGKFYKYPLEWKDSLMNMGSSMLIKVLLDYVAAKVKFYKREPKNFEAYIISTFGRKLAEFNILNYTHKIWGLPCSQLSVDWARQRIRGLTVTSLIANMIWNKGSAKTLVDKFYYPELGTGLIYETIKKRIDRHNPILLENEPVKITHDSNRITEVILKTGKFLRPENVVSSIPITLFVKLLNPLPPVEVLHSAKMLKYRSQVYLFLTINKSYVTKDQWIYFPDEEIPFGRISEMKNFSDKMAPKEHSSLFIEFFCWEFDDIWNKSKDELFELTIIWLERLGFVKREEVIDIFHFKQTHVYPVYDLDYKKHLGIIKSYLDKFSNLFYIGRPGRFKYTNQDHSLEMGILTARSILDKKRYDIEDVGSEKEYFERGYVS